jgi:hypothetical protein
MPESTPNPSLIGMYESQLANSSVLKVVQAWETVTAELVQAL